MSDAPIIAYVVLRCADLERSRRFYEALGLAFAAEQHGEGARHYATAISGVVLELYPLQDVPSSGARIGLRVADPAVTADAVRSAGGEVVRQGASDAVVRDPDGHTIHLASREVTRGAAGSGPL